MSDGTVKKIVIHCSDSTWGSALAIDKWHKERGWRGIGYLGVVGNGRPLPHMVHPWTFADGHFEWGRPLDDDTILEVPEIEAHAYGWNHKSVGICLIGKPQGPRDRCQFTPSQILTARSAIDNLIMHFGLSYDDVVGHYELDPAKTCPGMDMALFRGWLKGVVDWVDLMRAVS